MSMKSFGLFVQDGYRATRRLTLNFGLRYGVTFPIKDSRNLLANYVPTLSNGQPGGVVQVGDGISSPYPTRFNNVSPRLGFAYDVFGTGKTILRGGGGIIFVQPSIRTFMFSGGGLNLNPSTAALGVTPGNGSINAFLVDSTDVSQINWGVGPGPGISFFGDRRLQHRKSVQCLRHDPKSQDPLCGELESQYSTGFFADRDAAGGLCGNSWGRPL